MATPRAPGGALPPQQLQDFAQGTSALALDLSLRTAPSASTAAVTTPVTPKAAIVQPKSAPVAKSIAPAPAAKTPPPKTKKK